jgi:uncharacterized membrane protein YphA (DoxX/SURF4 family)
MTELSRLGRFFYASSMAGFGIQYLVHTFLGGPIPGPPWSPGRSLWAYATAVLLIATAACIASGRQIRPAAVILAILLRLHTVLAFGPRLVANIHDPGPWTSGFEILAMSGAALVLSGSLGEWAESTLRFH